MSVSSLPFLILNYGAEMMFILHARLIAQKVASETSRMIMNDIVRYMFSTEFIDELLRPQPLYSLEKTKEVFTSLTQSSVMRLSPMSMKKLFDLMTMGLKYQLFTIRHPLELLELTWTHLEEVRRIITPESQVFVTSLLVRLENFCSNLSPGDLAEIRKELLNFFAGRGVVISVLLENKLQTLSGSFHLPEDHFLPPLAVCEAPGAIRYYRNAALVSSEVFADHRDAALCYPPTVPPGAWNPMIAATRITRNGMNMYAPNPAAIEEPSASQTCVPPPPSEVLHAVTGELNYLSKLVRGNQDPLRETFKLSFFNEYEDDYDDGTWDKKSISHDEPMPKGEPLHTPTVSSHRTRKEGVQTENSDLMRIVAGLRIDKTMVKPAGADSDLLDIMDED